MNQAHSKQALFDDNSLHIILCCIRHIQKSDYLEAWSYGHEFNKWDIGVLQHA